MYHPPIFSARIPRLDTFRAIAALAVMWGHYANPLLPDWLAPLTATASAGVQFFFVLSGFLITALLIENGDEAPATKLRGFYVRRAYRIFPLYYFALVIGLLLAIPDFRETVLWTATYLTNFYMIYADNPKLGFAGHFWTLAVEEQFYLVWPTLLIFLRRAIWPIGIGLVLASVVFKQVQFGAGGYPVASMSPLACADALCIGALSALACKTWDVDRTEVALRWLLPLSSPAALAFVAYQSPDALVFTGAGAFFFFAWLIVFAVKDGPNGNSWGGRWLPALGLISYGIYVYHFMLLGLLHMSGLPDFWLTRTLTAVATIGAAWVSWRYLERAHD